MVKGLSKTCFGTHTKIQYNETTEKYNRSLNKKLTPTITEIYISRTQS